MNNEQYLLLKLGEEAKEIAIETDKAIQFGLESNNNGKLAQNNRERICSELNDLLASVELLNEQCGLGFAPDREAIEKKKEKVLKYQQISRDMGRVNN